MNEISQIKSQLRMHEWVLQVEEFQASGMSATAWCNANGIKPNTFFYRLKKVRELTLANMPADLKQKMIPTEAQPVAFKKLEVQTPAVGYQVAVILRLSNATLEIQEGASQSTVEAVLLALKNIC